MTILFFVFVVFSLLVLFYTNVMTHALCEQKQLPDSRVSRVFRIINICITILLISSYVEIMYHQ